MSTRPATALHHVRRTGAHTSDGKPEDPLPHEEGPSARQRQHEELRRRTPVGDHDIGGFLGHEPPQRDARG